MCVQARGYQGWWEAADEQGNRAEDRWCTATYGNMHGRVQLFTLPFKSFNSPLM